MMNNDDALDFCKRNATQINFRSKIAPKTTRKIYSGGPNHIFLKNIYHEVRKAWHVYFQISV